MRKFKRNDLIYKLKKEDSSSLRENDIIDIEDMEKYLSSSVDVDIDDKIKILSIKEAEGIIGKKCPDISISELPKSKNPRPDTIKKYKELFTSYPARIEEYNEWMLKYDKLVGLVQKLEDTKNNIDDLEDSLDTWCSQNSGIFIVRVNEGRYSWIQDPVQLVKEIRDKLNIPDKIKSLNENTSWYVEDIEFDEENNIFPTVFITIDDRFTYCVVSIPDNINVISDIIESYVETVQPKNILSLTKSKLDQKSQKTLGEWHKQNITNSIFPEDQKELKLFLSATAFLKEIQQLNKYPNSNNVGDLVGAFLEKI